MMLRDEDTWKFAYILLPFNGKPITNINHTELVIPHALPMGWTESSTFFCSASETAKDVAEQTLTRPNYHSHWKTTAAPSTNGLHLTVSTKLAASLSLNSKFMLMTSLSCLSTRPLISCTK